VHLSFVSFQSGSKLTTIQGQAFASCAIESIEIPRSVVILGSFCFSNCIHLSRLAFESDSQLASIEQSAFSNCPLLTSLTLPPVQALKGTEFLGSSISNLKFDENDNRFSFHGDFLIDSDEITLIHYFGCDCDLVVPGFIHKLAPASFSKCENVEHVAFESDCNLSLIPESGFEQCVFLVSICIPRTVQQVCARCFSRSERLSIVTFESQSKLIAIERSAFEDCTKLRSFQIPKSLQKLGRCCFRNCVELTTLIFEAGSHWSVVDKSPYDSPFLNCSSLESISICPPTDGSGTSGKRHNDRSVIVPYQPGVTIPVEFASIFRDCHALKTVPAMTAFRSLAFAGSSAVRSRRCQIL
jgi:hypothetical protein